MFKTKQFWGGTLVKWDLFCPLSGAISVLKAIIAEGNWRLEAKKLGQSLQIPGRGRLSVQRRSLAWSRGSFSDREPSSCLSTTSGFGLLVLFPQSHGYTGVQYCPRSSGCAGQSLEQGRMIGPWNIISYDIDLGCSYDVKGILLSTFCQGHCCS